MLDGRGLGEVGNGRKRVGRMRVRSALVNKEWNLLTILLYGFMLSDIKTGCVIVVFRVNRIEECQSLVV